MKCFRVEGPSSPRNWCVGKARGTCTHGSKNNLCDKNRHVGRICLKSTTRDHLSHPFKLSREPNVTMCAVAFSLGFVADPDIMFAFGPTATAVSLQKETAFCVHGGVLCVCFLLNCNTPAKSARGCLQEHRDKMHSSVQQQILFSAVPRQASYILGKFWESKGIEAGTWQAPAFRVHRAQRLAFPAVRNIRIRRSRARRKPEEG